MNGFDFAGLTAVGLILLGAMLWVCASKLGAIDYRRPVENKDRRFGSEEVYYQATVSTKHGLKPALFTAKQIEVALVRAERNPEDLK